jgi:hypothetical protein
MKVMVMIFSLVLNGSSAWAVDLSKAKTFNRNWSYTPTFTKKDKNSLLKIKVFKRYLWIDRHPIQVSETNFTYLKNPQEKIDLKTLSETIKKSFPANALSTRTISNGVEVTGTWKRMNRFIKIDLIKKSENFIIVTTFTRAGLTKILMPEINQLHSMLKTYTYQSDSKNAQKTTFLNYFIPKAVAEEFDIPGLTDIMDGSNTTTGATENILNSNSNPINTVKDSLGTIDGTVTIKASDDINANWKGTNDALNGFSKNVDDLNVTVGDKWGDTNTIMNKQGTDFNKNLANGIDSFNSQATTLNNTANKATDTLNNQATTLNNTANKAIDTIDLQATKANNNWEKTNTNLEKANVSLEKANTNWEKTNEIVDRQGNAANANWKETNRIAEKLTDPAHLAKMAYFTAAGAALGSITMNLAIEGVSAGISFLYELFTGTKKKQLEWQDFQQAMQVWDTQLSDLVKMEQIVDEFIAAFAYFGDKNVNNDYMKNLTGVMREMRFDRDVYMEQFKNDDLTLSCRHAVYTAADEIDQKLKEYDKIIQFSSKNSISADKNQNYFCQQLKELQRKILTAETQMQDLRLAILKAENQFYDKSTETRDTRADKGDAINSDISKTISNREDYNEMSTEAMEEAYEYERDTWVDSCIDGANPEGLKIEKDVDNRFVHFFVARSRCKTAFDSTHSLKNRGEKGQKILTAENKLRQKLTIKSNDKIDINLSEEQMNWLTRLHMDAYCYQFAHKDPKSIPAKCMNFPELLYSMNMSKGYEKASKTYKDRCEDRYLTGIQKLAEAKN